MKKTLILLAGCLLAVTACDKETERVGCTDYRANNFIANAQVDDGTCQYPDEIQTIFSMGGFGGWDGDSIGAGFLITECLGALEVTSMVMPIDTMPIDTMMVDTSMVDTSMVENMDFDFLTVVSDNNGDYNVAIELVNPRNTSFFNDGVIKFKVKKSPGQDFSTFDMYIYGSNAVTDGECWQQRRSNFITLSALSITEDNFIEATVALSEFVNRQMEGPGVVFGLKGQALPNMPVMEIEEILWTVDVQ